MDDFTNKKTAVALGNFDGLHKGHIAVINEAVIRRSNGLLPCIVTFETHPQKILTGLAPEALMTQSVFETRAEKLGCRIVKLNFQQVMNMSPREFFDEILVKKLGAGFVSCGFNYRFGKKGSGNAELLAQYCKSSGIGFSCVSGVEFEGESISSTRIRTAIRNGETEKANAMLGDCFSYDFEVMYGDRIGNAKLGFPTINQIFPDDFIVPASGVYASKTEIDSIVYPSMTNIGKRPTVNGNQLRSETHIIGFTGDLYGKNPKVSLLSRMRDEIKFPSLEALSEQLKKDCKNAELIYNEGSL